mmetsp:Transcript_17987/g.63186  ORF Transcript_17987/g.63186 Transcript_17987/m.63186 type:complete len:215 (-) Transcript_17987:542-1186(-)
MLQSLQRDRLAPLLGGQGVIATAVAAHANFGTCTSTSQSLQSDVVPDCPAQPVQTMSNGTKHSLFNGIPSEYWYHGGIATADTAQAVFSTGACTSPSLQRDQLAAGLGGQGDIEASDGGQAHGGTGASMSQMRSITACGNNLTEDVGPAAVTSAEPRAAAAPHSERSASADARAKFASKCASSKRPFLAAWSAQVRPSASTRSASAPKLSSKAA